MKIARGLALAVFFAGACQKTTGPEPSSDPAPGSSAEVAPVVTPSEHTTTRDAAAPPDATLPPEAPDAEPNASLDLARDAATPVATLDAAASAPTCIKVARPPTLDVRLRFSNRRVRSDPSLPAVDVLVAKITASGSLLKHEIWANAAPTACHATADADDMSVRCVSADSRLEARVHVVGNELVVDSVTLAGYGFTANDAAPKAPSPTRQASVKVPCGTRLRVHPASRGTN
jgi:hypothetical protein